MELIGVLAGFRHQCRAYPVESVYHFQNFFFFGHFFSLVLGPLPPSAIASTLPHAGFQLCSASRHVNKWALFSWNGNRHAFHEFRLLALIDRLISRHLLGTCGGLLVLVAFARRDRKSVVQGKERRSRWWPY